MGEPKLVDTAAAGRELHELGKHRTEVIMHSIGQGYRGGWCFQLSTLES